MAAIHLFDASPKIYFGENSLDHLLSLPEDKVLLVTDPFMISSGLVKTVTSRLERAGAPYTVFSEIEPDPSIETVAAGLGVLFREKPDTVVALGGGSAIDAAKAMLYFCMRFKHGLMDSRYVHRPQFIAIPTTSGTGSEVTSYAVVSDRRNGVKIPLSDKSMIPDAAILDPGYTRTLPAEMIAYTGMDVLTHAMEAYVSGKANDFTDMCAKEAAATALSCLPALYSGSSDARTREKMYTASTLAGLAFTNAALGLCHGIAHTLGAQFHMPHGKANAVALPYVISFNAGLGRFRGRGTPEKYAALSRHLGLGADDDLEAARHLLAEVLLLNDRFGIPVSLRESGVSESDYLGKKSVCVAHIMEDSCTGTNPVRVAGSDVASLLDDIYNGRLEVN